MRSVGAEMPGLELSLALAAHPDTPVLLLTNHGVILQWDPGSDLLDRWMEFERRVCRKAGFRLLGELLENPAKAVSLRLAPMPWRELFPDASVLRTRIQAQLVDGGATPSGEPLWRMPEAAWNVDRDACEIFLASQILHESDPALRELPERIRSSVGGLPTEKFRLGVKSGG